MGVAVPAMVSRYGRSWRHPEYTPVDTVQVQSLSIPLTRARLIHLAQRAPDTSFASPESPFLHVDNQYTGYSERQPKIEVLRTTTFVQAQKTGTCDHKPRMSLRYRRISTYIDVYRPRIDREPLLANICRDSCLSKILQT